MKKNKEKDTLKKKKKTWSEPDFEIHSLIDENLSIRGMDGCPDECQCPGGDPSS